eukprot:TRINITY_DN10742_c0_g1_i1.p1 TRINITY_DN10742_c0_g1~~TRINITY_DN10742_c0_g1_i1.p1  ORF type:complete len:752 (-),score=176.82 TRINITY_DN10742_c0_g1_i1:256-2511(-)
MKGMGKEQPSDNLYIAGLPADMKEDACRRLFGNYGQVVQCKVLPSRPGAMDGVALVRFGTEMEATSVKDLLNGMIPEGLHQPITIKYKAGGGGGGYEYAPPVAASGKGGGGFEGEPCDNLYVMGLPPTATEEQTRQFFGTYGSVIQCKVMPPKPGQTGAVALVRFASEPEATLAKENLNGVVPDGSTNMLTVRYKAGGNAGGGAFAAPAPAAVTWAQPPPPATVPPARGPGVPPPGAGAVVPPPVAEGPSDNLYVKGLPPGLSDDEVKEIFGDYGTVLQCKVLPASAASMDTAALVRLESVEAAVWIKDTLNGTTLPGCDGNLVIKFKAGANKIAAATQGAMVPAAKGVGKAAALAGGYQPPPPAVAPYQASHPPPAAVGGYQPPPPAVMPGSHAGGGEPTQSDNLYVSGLPNELDDHSLRQIFEHYGTVIQCKVLPPNGRDGAVGLVRMGSVSEGKWVKDNLDGNIPEGLDTPIYIKFKADRTAAPPPAATIDHGGKGWGKADVGGHYPRSAPYGGGKGEHVVEPPSDNLYVENLPAEIDDNTLREIFSKYGNLSQCKVLAGRPGMAAVALVRFSSLHEAAQVKNLLNGNIPEGLDTPIQIKFKAVGGAPASDGKGAVGKGYGAIVSPGGVPGGLMGKALVKAFEDSGALPCGTGIGVSDVATLYIAGLPRDMDDLDLYKIFASFGAIKPRGATTVKNPDGSCKGFGFVNFIDPVAAQQAITICDGAQMPDGNLIKVSIKMKPGQNPLTM